MTYESIATLTIDDFHACITLYEISKNRYYNDARLSGSN